MQAKSEREIHLSKIRSLELEKHQLTALLTEVFSRSNDLTACCNIFFFVGSFQEQKKNAALGKVFSKTLTKERTLFEDRLLKQRTAMQSRYDGVFSFMFT